MERVMDDIQWNSFLRVGERFAEGSPTSFIIAFLSHFVNTRFAPNLMASQIALC